MIRLLFVKVVCLLVFSSAWAKEINGKGDFQFWEHQHLSVKLNKCTTFYFENEFRWGGNASELYLSYIQSGIRINPTDWLSLGPGYRQISSLRLATRDRIPVYDPLFDVILTFKPRKWEIQDRTRIQYLIFESERNTWVIRNRLKLYSPWKWGKMKLNPFLDEEVFFREERGFSENRLGFGGRINPNKQFSTEFTFMLRHIEIANVWRLNHVARFNFFFKY